MADVPIVSTILEKLKEKAIDKASEAWEMVSGVEQEVERLESNFEAIQCELEDAEEKQFLDRSLKHWFDRFKQVAYDMEDVLDDWSTAMQELQTDIFGCVPQWKVCRSIVSCFSSGNQVVRRYDIASRIKEINEELQQIVNDKAKLKLIERENKELERPESTSYVNVSELTGRDTVKEGIIMRSLQCGTSEGEDGNHNIPTISVVGMGGIGKTALAQLIYNDDRVKTHFSKIIWVSVPHPFNKPKIARIILQGLDPDSTILLQNPVPLQLLLKQISLKIRGEKFLLVLDDVWTERSQDWEELKAAFKGSILGSWILVTTRKELVVSAMNSAYVFPLNLLSEEACWSILAQNAFDGRNKDSRENLEDIGRELAKKCGGLPLAAKALGCLLQQKQKREEWEEVLKSEIWESEFEKETFTPLLLSYYDLRLEVRRCLTYCAIFPKNHKFANDELIQHWMAHGYLKADSVQERQLKGEDYVNYLATRSFFQDLERDDDGNIVSFKMHDLVYDFVKFLSKGIFVSERICKDLTSDFSSKRARHVRLLLEDKSFPMSTCGTEKLRSLVAIQRELPEVASRDELPEGVTSEAWHNLFSQSKRLRLLEFDSLKLVARMAHDIGNLIHLRYLSLKSCSGVKILPETICELSNLGYLNLQDCSDLQKLPDGIGKLINLRYLCTEGCRALSYYPKGISKLSSLIRLSGDIKMSADSNHCHEFSIGDLEKLDLLTGNLRVEFMGDGINQNEAKRAKLHNKIHLKQMHIHICSPHIRKNRVLQALNPPSSLAVVVTDYQAWSKWISKLKMTQKEILKYKLRNALGVQKAALQFLDAAGQTW